MAQRPVFLVSENMDFLKSLEMEFTYHNGFSVVQKQRSIDSLHETFNKQYPDKKILEISSKSKLSLGVQLSAFNLAIKSKSGRFLSVESMFQASKVFENGGPYTDLLYATSYDAKKDSRLKTSGKIIGFSFNGRSFPCEPKTLFYNWLYINTLVRNEELARELLTFDAFTDIEFNPKKSLNCQAEAAAVYVALARQGLLKLALQDQDSFLRVVYGNEEVDLFAGL